MNILKNLRISPTRLCLLCAAAWLACVLPSPAQEPPAADPEALKLAYNEGMLAFQNGNYAVAAAKMEQIVAQAGKEAKLEPVYFTLGASYFNLEQYSKAIEMLKKYQQMYPTGARIADAIFSIGQAAMLEKDWSEAAAQFAKLEGTPAYRETALLYGGAALKEAGKNDEAIAVFEKLISPEIRTALGVKGAMTLAGLYAQKKDSAKANALVGKILQKVDLVDNLIRLNAMALDLGDNLLESGRPAEALKTYRAVRSRDEVIKFHADRVVTLQKKLDDGQAALRADPSKLSQLLPANNQLKVQIAEAQKLADEARGLPEFMPGLLMRIGRAYYDQGAKWESIVVYDEVVGKHPEAKERESALYAEMVSCSEANLPATARRLGDVYLKEFPSGPNANTVGYLLGASALQSNDPQTAESYFGRMLADQPASSFKEQMRFLLGNAKFVQGKFDEAAKDYRTYLTDFPEGLYVEDVVYRLAVGAVFAGQYEAGLKLLEDYLARYPKGNYAADASYRLAVCLYSAQQYDDVIARCVAWEKEYGSHEQLGEVLALQADALAAQNQIAEAVPVYIRSYKAATTDEVLNYSLFEAQKGLQKQGDWAGISAMFEEFAREKPDHPTAVMAIYWMGKAKAREGKTEEAKQFLAETIRRYLSDPKREAVEQLLAQLAQLCRKPAPAAEGAAPVDPAEEMEKLIGDTGASDTAKARLAYARSELARLRKQPAEVDKQLAALTQYPPAALSPVLLALAGDYLLGRGETERAEQCYRLLLEEFPKSDVVDFAYNGLGEIAWQKKDYEKALKFFDDAINKVGAAQKLKEVSIGRARALLALGRLDEAQKQFEQVASVREWRGEATAFAVYSLGDIEFQRNRYAEANAYYQRVFVAYQKFLPWVAKAYVRSAECFEKLGKPKEAAATYKEMLRNTRLVDFAETAEARRKLEQMGEGAQG